MINIRKLEAELWESADLLRAGSKLTSNQYCMPVLGLIFLRYAYSRFKLVEAEIQKNRPSRGGRVLPVEASDFAEKSALYLPKEAQYEYLVNRPDNISAAQITNSSGQLMNSLGEVVNHAMELVEAQSEQLSGVLPIIKNGIKFRIHYTIYNIDGGVEYIGHTDCKVEQPIFHFTSIKDVFVQSSKGLIIDNIPAMTYQGKYNISINNIEAFIEVINTKEHLQDPSLNPFYTFEDNKRFMVG